MDHLLGLASKFLVEVAVHSVARNVATTCVSGVSLSKERRAEVPSILSYDTRWYSVNFP